MTSPGRSLLPLALCVAVCMLLHPAALPVDGALTIHLVPHSHEDVGYEKTLDQYYYGSNQSIRAAGVQYRMDSIVPALEADPTRRFIQVETAFFHRWWVEQTEALQQRVIALVHSGQLEMVSGGWCMHDEAATIAVDMIDQMTLGHKFLIDTFGTQGGIPRSGWQIDPFGHSSTNAALMAAMGFDSLYFCRIDWEDKIARVRTLGSRATTGHTSTLWSGTTVEHYGAPPDFCIDPGCDGGGDEPIMDDPRLEGDNVASRIAEFLELVVAESLSYAGKDILITMGGDFLYSNAARNFKEMDKIIKYANEASKGEVVLKYSTPGEYTWAKLNQNLTWTVNANDFFPYADQPHGYWTGFFTSRPLLKRMVRSASSTLQTARQIEWLGAAGTGANLGPTRSLLEAVAIACHHDAVAGTEMQHVAYDYALRLASGWTESEDMMTRILGDLVSTQAGSIPPALSQCRLAANESLCAITQQATLPGSKMAPLLVMLYNPLAHSRKGERVSVPVERSDLIVLDSNMQPVPSQVGDHDSDEGALHEHYISRRNILRRNSERQRRAREAKKRYAKEVADRTRDEEVVSEKAEDLEPVPARYTLHFLADVQPLGVNSYFVVSTSSGDDLAPPTQAADAAAKEEPTVTDTLVSMSNGLISLAFSSQTGLLVGYTDLQTNPPSSVAIGQEWLYYESFVDETGQSQNAGAYVSRFSNNNVPFPIAQGGGAVANLTLGAQGPIVFEVHQQFSPWCVQTIRLTRGSAAVEIEWTVGPVPLQDADGVARGKEVVTRFSLDASLAPAPFSGARGMDNGAIWCTDSNMREMQARRRDFRPTWDMSHEEPVASNYVPINTMAYMNDAATNGGDGTPTLQLTVLNDRTQGCASLSNTSLEIMVHRRLVGDDNKGVHEPVNETLGGIEPYSASCLPATCAPKRLGEGISVRGTHVLLIQQRLNSSDPSFASEYRPAQQRMYLPLQASFAVLSSDVSEYVRSHSANLSMVVELPPALELMTLTGWDEGSVLVRLAHSYARGEDPSLSQPVQFDLATLFPGRSVQSVKELSITTNQLAEEVEQRRASRAPFAHARAKGEPEEREVPRGPVLAAGSTVVTIFSMQIRTFQMTLA